MLSLQKKNLYEPSEIWVGRDGQAGVHVHKPKVRGDHIMWVCGRHKTRSSEGWYDSAGTQPPWSGSGSGTVIPCHVEPSSGVDEVQNQFGELGALKKCIEKVDTLVFKFLSKQSEGGFEFVERSDCLL